MKRDEDGESNHMEICSVIFNILLFNLHFGEYYSSENLAEAATLIFISDEQFKSLIPWSYFWAKNASKKNRKMDKFNYFIRFFNEL